MPALIPDLKRYLAGEGYTGSLQDMWKQALASESGSSVKSVQDLERAFLEAQGLSGSLPDMWKEYLEGLGYTGSVQDMFRAAVAADGLFVAEASDVSLADVQQIYTDLGGGIGYLRDGRIASGLFSDAGTTTSVDSGLVQRAYNQSPVSGASTTYMEETYSLDMPTFYLGQGLYGTSAALFDAGVLPGLASENVTLFVAAKGTLDGGGENDQLVSLYGANNFNLQLTGRPDGPGYRVYGVTLGTYAGSVAANVDENNIVVLMLQLSADGNNVEVRCNNTLVLDTAITGSKSNLVNEHEYELRKLEFNNAGDRLLGWGVLPGKATDEQRQTICNYFQQNAGEVAPPSL